MCVIVAKVARHCRGSIDIEGAARYQSMKPMAIAITRRCGNDEHDDDDDDDAEKVDEEVDDGVADAVGDATGDGVDVVTATLVLLFCIYEFGMH